MPLINGVKMACEPCIRGHRSTKCTHANERLMVPVRKPGRPLSSCPHPSKDPCACPTVTAAIPRKQALSCHCGPVTPTGSVQDEQESQESQSEQATPSTSSKSATSSTGTGTGTSTHRVQKPNAKNGSRSRKQSVATSAFERTDPSQLKVSSPQDGPEQQNGNGNGVPAVNSHMAAMYGGYPFGPMSVGNGEQNFAPHPMMMPMFQQPMHGHGHGHAHGHSHGHSHGHFHGHNHVHGHNIAHGHSHGHGHAHTHAHSHGHGHHHVHNHGQNHGHNHGHMMNVQSPNGLTNGHSVTADTNGSKTSDAKQTSGGSCCGGRTDNRERPSPQPVSTTESPSDASTDGTMGGCCSVPDSQHNGHTPGTMSPPDVCHQNGNVMMMPHLPPHMAMGPGMYPFCGQPTVYTYPPNFGSYMQPMQFEQWKQITSGLNFNQPIGSCSMSNPMMFPDLAAMGAGSMHKCACGSSCQCIGCSAHPYNDATQKYVRSAWSNGGDDSTTSPASVIDALNGADLDAKIQGIATPKGTNGFKTPPVSNGEEGMVSPPATHTPSEVTSVMGEEQVLSDNDFFFVTYPFGDSCGGDMAMCPCGDDCQCIGCGIHSVAGPSEQLV